MRKFLSLAVMCSLALPAMAFAQPEAPKEAADDMGTASGADPGTPTEPAIDAMPEPPKVAADDVAPADAEEGARPFLDGLSWMVMASAFYRIDGYIGDGVLQNESYNALGYP